MIMILPELSLLTPILYNVKAKAVGNKPIKIAMNKSKIDKYTNSDIEIGKNKTTINIVGHQAKNKSKLPLAGSISFILALSRYIFFFENIRMAKINPDKIPIIKLHDMITPFQNSMIIATPVIDKTKLKIADFLTFSTLNKIRKSKTKIPCVYNKKAAIEYPDKEIFMK